MSTKQKFIKEGGDVNLVHENEKPKVGKEYAKKLAIMFNESVEYDDSGVIAPKDLSLQDISESLDGLKIQRCRFAIKNSKNESDILSKSAFFKTKDGKLLISRAKGVTYRRNHQGSNGWSLFNVEGIMPSRPKSPRKESWIDFGTYGGAENNIPWLYENDIIPISQEEWEERTGRDFVNSQEFSWFNGGLESYKEILEERFNNKGYADDLDLDELSNNGIFSFKDIYFDKTTKQRYSNEKIEPTDENILFFQKNNILGWQNAIQKYIDEQYIDNLDLNSLEKFGISGVRGLLEYSVPNLEKGGKYKLEELQSLVSWRLKDDFEILTPDLKTFSSMRHLDSRPGHWGTVGYDVGLGRMFNDELKKFFIKNNINGYEKYFKKLEHLNQEKRNERKKETLNSLDNDSRWTFDSIYDYSYCGYKEIVPCLMRKSELEEKRGFYECSLIKLDFMLKKIYELQKKGDKIVACNGAWADKNSPFYNSKDGTYKGIKPQDTFLIEIAPGEWRYSIGQFYSNGGHTLEQVIALHESKIQNLNSKINMIDEELKNPTPSVQEVEKMLKDDSDLLVQKTMPCYDVDIDVEIPQKASEYIQGISFDTSYGEAQGDPFFLLKGLPSIKMRGWYSEGYIKMPEELKKVIKEKRLQSKFNLWKEICKNGGSTTVYSCKGMSATEVPAGTLVEYGSHPNMILPDGTQLIHNSYGSGRSFGYNYVKGDKVKITLEDMSKYRIVYPEKGKNSIDKVFGVTNKEPSSFV